MSNPQLPRSFQMPARRGVGLCIGFITGVLVSGSAMGAGQISTLNLSERRATPFSYEVDGVEYLWGQGNNQYLESFSLDGQIYDFGLSADRVEIRRDDIEGVASGEPCGVFVQSLDYSQATRTQAADFPADPNGSGNCDVEAMLASRIINRGAVDVFSNTAPDAKNIERIDYLFSYGASAPLLESGMEQVGHLASEKSGNNPVKMAAILALDEAGNPASYGPLVLIGASGCVDPAICYGITDLMHSYSMLQNNPNAPQSFPVETERSMESVGMAFVSLQALGLSPGQRYYGVSLFADDVDSTNHNLLDPTSFPDNTSDDYIVVGDDADIYGGLSGYFAGAALNEVAGSVFLDANGNGQPDDGEAGISNVSIILYSDENGNGLIDEGVDQPLGDP
ncbi:MAG: hypothetical protein KTR32_21830, partial [Granulosicoccus sp.]|nr:hypothetical protein [Granulosicoccus sp.]